MTAASRLAWHAALPAAIDSTFLHLLRINFFADGPDRLPYEAEAELLLSPLFTEVAGDLYEMRPERRGEFLRDLVARYGEARLQKVANLLDHYTAGNQQWRAVPELAYAQHMTALAVRDPALARRRLDEAESAGRAAGALHREWYVAMRQHLDDQRLEAEPEEAPADPALSSPGSRAYLVAPGAASPPAELLAVQRILTDPLLGGMAAADCVILTDNAPDAVEVNERRRPASETLFVHLMAGHLGAGRAEEYRRSFREATVRLGAKRLLMILEGVKSFDVRHGSSLQITIPFAPNDPRGSASAVARVLAGSIAQRTSLTFRGLFLGLVQEATTARVPGPSWHASDPAGNANSSDVALIPADFGAEAAAEEYRLIGAMVDATLAGDEAGAGRAFQQLARLAEDRFDFDTAAARECRAAGVYQGVGDWAQAVRVSAAAALSHAEHDRSPDRARSLTTFLQLASALRGFLRSGLSVDRAHLALGVLAAGLDSDWLAATGDSAERDEALQTVSAALAADGDDQGARRLAAAIRNDALRREALRSIETAGPAPASDASADFRSALDRLYWDAGRPGMRRISADIRRNPSMPDTVSHETVGQILRGELHVRWSRVECVVRQLSLMSDPPRDHEADVGRLHTLWSRAKDATPGVPPREAAETAEVTDPVFYLSHARAKPPAGGTDDGVGRLFADLNNRVNQLVPVPAGADVGFLDRRIEAGKFWNGEAERNLGRAQVFVALLSPRYLHGSEWCAMEWDYFRRRVVRRRDGVVPAPGVSAMIPVLWTPLAGPVPAAIGAIERFAPGSPIAERYRNLYEAEGLLGAMHLDEAAYTAMVWTLARQIQDRWAGLRVAPGDATPPPDLRRSFDDGR